MFLLALDSEQAAIVKHSLAAARGFYAARLERADPDKIISNSLSLQDRKVRNLLNQLDRPMSERIGDLASIFEGSHRDLMEVAMYDVDQAKRAAARVRLAPVILELLSQGEVPE